MSQGLVALSSAVVLTVYSAGYLRTQAAADRIRRRNRAAPAGRAWSRLRQRPSRHVGRPRSCRPTPGTDRARFPRRPPAAAPATESPPSPPRPPSPRRQPRRRRPRMRWRRTSGKSRAPCRVCHDHRRAAVRPLPPRQPLSPHRSRPSRRPPLPDDHRCRGTGRGRGDTSPVPRPRQQRSPGGRQRGARTGRRRQRDRPGALQRRPCPGRATLQGRHLHGLGHEPARRHPGPDHHHRRTHRVGQDRPVPDAVPVFVDRAAAADRS